MEFTKILYDWLIHNLDRRFYLLPHHENAFSIYARLHPSIELGFVHNYVSSFIGGNIILDLIDGKPMVCVYGLNKLLSPEDPEFFTKLGDSLESAYQSIIGSRDELG